MTVVPTKSPSADACSVHVVATGGQATVTGIVSGSGGGSASRPAASRRSRSPCLDTPETTVRKRRTRGAANARDIHRLSGASTTLNSGRTITDHHVDGGWLCDETQCPSGPAARSRRRKAHERERRAQQRCLRRCLYITHLEVVTGPRKLAGSGAFTRSKGESCSTAVRSGAVSHANLVRSSRSARLSGVAPSRAEPRHHRRLFRA